jgi:hypothetical protein
MPAMRIPTIALLALALTGCSGEAPEAPESRTKRSTEPVFVDMAGPAGLDFAHWNGMSGELYMVEIFGPGAALFDQDNDGDLDLYLVQGNLLGRNKGLSDATFPPPGQLPLTDRLYRNDLVVNADGTRELRFTDVTDASALEATGYGMGVAAGDYDNDGRTDLYVTNWGPNQMWRNNGDGTFSDVTEKTGTADDRWSTSAAFADYDADGLLDLYVGNYLDLSFENHKRCKSPTGGDDYCGPRDYAGVNDRLFRNRGDGTFEDVTEVAGIGAIAGKGLGVVTADLDGDGRTDFYVANDGMENIFWRNLGNGTFRDDALFAGCALNRKGRPEAGMGVDAADYDGDGDEDLIVTHLSGETNTLYVNEGGGVFEDRSARSDLGAPTWNDTGFGTAWFDYDNDGLLDLFAANGAVRMRLVDEDVRPGDPIPLEQPNRLFRNVGDGRFEDVSAVTGESLEASDTSRGAIFGDVDNDGDTDVVIANNNAPVRLLLNEIGASRSWLGLRLVGTEGRRDMLGAQAEIVLGSGSLWRRARTDGGYCSARDPRVLVGLGRAEDVERVRVLWPDGSAEEWTEIELSRYTTLVQGSGHALERP